MEGLPIENVVPESLAEELEIEAGDRLVAINGHVLRDIIDYNYFSADGELTLEVVKADGEVWEIETERDESEPLGLIFAAPAPAQCGNKCIFCFVHQLPKGLRKPLYVKDEDYRLSFLYGNYVTLANIDDSDLERIKAQRLSPLYVSVHATDTLVRERMLGKRGIPPILEIMKELAACRITMHTQVVLCPGINDGPVLEKTVADLAALFPAVASLAVVPVGLTKHRQGLPPLQPVTKEYAAALLAHWQPELISLEQRLGEPFLFFADEFYIKGETAFPPLAAYGDLPQIENGVGMVPVFLEEADQVILEARKLKPMTVTVVTGESPYPYLEHFLRRLTGRTGVTFTAIPVKNCLFGDTVTVTGLVSGGDILEGLKNVALGDVIVVPDVMLKEGEGIFIDDLNIDDLHHALGREVLVSESTPRGLYTVISELQSA
jgi:putative radical SAM enzyme (TIGR03279 family)